MSKKKKVGLVGVLSSLLFAESAESRAPKKKYKIVTTKNGKKIKVKI